MGAQPDSFEKWRLEGYSDLVLDFTGTLSKDGVLLPGVADRLVRLAERFRITVLTADTFGTAGIQLKGLPLDLRIIEKGPDKAAFVRRTCGARAIAIGNGRNDAAMMEAAGLGIAVIGPEGAAAELLKVADVVVGNINDAFDLLENPLRIRSTLRD
ncbi:HAD hydrolase family protein [Candidatus Fermentibacteria bacterium]|nr:HAD hydrolase family protein [Candidatus Fermentibacteria bacterium]